MVLRYLRKVDGFSSNPDSHFDPFACEAFLAVGSDSQKAFVSDVRSQWHRPSGDRALLDEGLLKYNITTPKRCYDGDYLAILKRTFDEMEPRTKLIPLTLGAAAAHPDFPRTTSPGFPWVFQDKHTKAEVLADTASVGKIHRAWDSIGRGIPWSLPDSMAYHRVIASPKEKVKVRPVWGYPVDVILEEARFFFPFFKYIKDKCNVDDVCYGLGMETARSGHHHLARSFTESPSSLALCCDISNFDARVPAWIIRDCFSFLSSWFDFSKVEDSEGKIWNVKVEQTTRRWKAMVSYFINTKVRSPSGLRVQKAHGIPSGSMWTNPIDTFVNAVQTRVAIRRVTGHLPTKDYYFGDDGVVFIRDSSLDLDAMAHELSSTFGAILSVDKTILTDNVCNIQWLGYFYRPEGPRRSMDFLIASSIYPEREVEHPLESCSRLLGQMYSCMDPHAAVFFYDATQYLLRQHELNVETLDSYVRSKSIKAYKYLITLGLTPEEIVTPDCFPDPFGQRYIPAVLPRPCARRFVHMRSQTLPPYAFAPEAYANPGFRPSGFLDFDKFQLTYDNPHDYHEDSGYFTS